MMSAESFFVSEDGSSSTTVAEPRWGYTERRCTDCGRSWGPTRCSDPTCNSMGFTDTYHEPVPFMSRVTDKLRPKKAPPRASAAQVEHICALRAGVTALLADLRALDTELRDAVRADVEELGAAQGYVHRSLATTGDRAPRNIDGLGLGLEALADYLGAAVTNLEETK